MGMKQENCISINSFRTDVGLSDSNEDRKMSATVM